MKEQDYIEKLITRNLEKLNDNEPPEGHLQRFEERLKKQGKRNRFTVNFVLKIAAAAVFTFLVVNQGIIWFSPDRPDSVPAVGEQKMNLAAVSPEYEEVEFYYTNAIDGGLTQWEKLASEGMISNEEQQMMETELTEFEKIYEKLQADLAASPNDERVISAMLEYYKTKLDLISMIISKLEEVQQKKENNNETEM